MANALGGLMILVLAGASAWLIRRYVLEIQRARDALDSLNASYHENARNKGFVELHDRLDPAARPHPYGSALGRCPQPALQQGAGEGPLMGAREIDPYRARVVLGVVPQPYRDGSRVLVIRDDMGARVLLDHRHGNALSP